VHFFPQKVNDLLSRRPQYTKLTTPTLQTSPVQQKFPYKLASCFAWGVLTTYPYKLRQKISRPGGACAPSVPPARLRL